jgi:hypothetical protein
LANRAHCSAVKSLKPTFDRLGQRLVADARQDARQAITTPAGHRHVGATGRCTVNRGQPGGVVAGKPHMRGQSVGVDLDLMAHGLQPGHATAKGGLVALGA